MTQANPFSGQSTPPADSPSPLPMQVVPHTAWDKFEMLLERAGEYLNPILVKEARQALKSKQFVITFTLVLVFGWGWSLLGVAAMGQDAFYAPSGAYMLMGYFWVLAFPLGVIVPFAAFRSLAAEREDGTYELLSITTLWPRQIVGGKLGSSLLQMIVYLSALSPCIAFTYLLRGIDILSILLFVAYAVAASLLLSMAGLLLATVSRSRHWQVVLSVVMILALTGIYIFGSSMAHAFLNSGEVMPLDQPDFWIVHLVLLSALASFFVLLFLAAAARISFASDNRSTKLRYVMLAQQTLLTGWVMYYTLRFKEEENLFYYFSLAAIYWTATGAIMCGENPQLSQRVRRSLPQSLVARMNLTWFNPGPGTGYIFAVCNLLTVLALGLLVGLEIKAAQAAPVARFSADALYMHVMALGNSLDFSDKWLWFGILSFCYVTCYLGVGRLILMLARRAARVGLFVSFLLQLVLLMVGTLVPWAVQMSVFYEYYYSVLQITSPFLTLGETMFNDILSHQVKILFWTIPIVPWVMIPASGFVVLLNLLLSAGEAAHERQSAPQRVVEDERVLHPERFERPARLSPWDDAPEK